MNALSIATININDITAPTRMGILAEFIRKHDFDIIFLQEVTSPDVLSITGYETYLNIGTFMHGTTIVAKCKDHLTNILNLPTGRAIAATFPGVRLINIYPPVGHRADGRKGRFFTTWY